MYHYEIMHLPGKDNRVVDGLPRLPLTYDNCEEVDDNECDVSFPYDDVVFIEDHGMELEFSKHKWIKEMQRDGILAKVLDGAVKLEDVKIRNLRHIILCEGVNMRETDDEIKAYLLGCDYELQVVADPDIHFAICVDSGHNANKCVSTTDGISL
ncbi:hypothetical protein NDU88_000908 [Pleurodeles waltl]|uniref:Uncharacterized protein n=1 Tax=Pleurodeles waltl TaxID=8319 RepID=A0AAV7LX73_PLEWA|nr:hypothetical protein NDU88_000908 [Pleurodeles waltl]